jgi:hypothetical protein
VQRLAWYYHRLRGLFDESTPGPREDAESTVVIADCLIRGLEDGSILLCAVDGGPLSRLTISHCNLDGTGFLEYESKTMFAIHWDIDRLLACDATIRILCERTRGTDDQLEAELEEWLGDA